MPSFYDDDPDVGPARLVEYDVLHVTGPGSMPLTDPSGWRQRMHPTDAMRGHGQSDIGSGPRVACQTVGCQNKASEKHKDCSSCRSRRLAKCACGRVRSYGAARCLVCTTVDRKIRKQRLWESRA